MPPPRSAAEVLGSRSSAAAAAYKVARVP